MDTIYSLLLLFNLTGINAASGLQYHQDQLYIVSDNSPYLYHYHVQEERMDKVLLDSLQQTEMVAKKDKKDFEALCDVGDALVIVGSGSKPQRQEAFIYDKRNSHVRRVSLDSIYQRMQEIGKVDKQNFNIEGLTYDNGTWYFLNRGNGEKKQNVIFTVAGDSDFILRPETLSANHIELSDIQNYTTGFSDGVIVDGRLFFIATAEDSASTYHDGENKGSYISYINLSDWTLGQTHQLSSTKKLEGLAVYGQSADTITFILCEDPDDESNNRCPIYRYDFDLGSAEI
ncbi:DUF6929 family protein [Sphingobacterium chuzhouense]|uniref:Uncharacterized protein n=1 Tax=Sphingobacterium chuzhouense TaxID=1742264 RepID=A0ABR7XU67_9SPHI|nr:hypothetical protein [Sphingobacterium chuzhouense]MBD1422552.1 hypothetical protein [Sphingobacterium chuzhouense]